MKRRIIGMALLGISCCICQAAVAAEPKKIVTEFFTAAFVDRQPKEAALRYVSPDSTPSTIQTGKMVESRLSMVSRSMSKLQPTNARSSASLRSAIWSLFIVTARRSLMIAAALSSTIFGSKKTYCRALGCYAGDTGVPQKRKHNVLTQ